MTTVMITRRGLFGILAGAVAAPIVVRSGLLMPVKATFDAAAWRDALVRTVDGMINPPLVANWATIAEGFYPKPGAVSWVDATAFDRFLSATLSPPPIAWARLT